MTTLAVFVGLDYHQAFVQMCVLDSKGTVLMNRKCVNSALALVDSRDACRSIVLGVSVSTGISRRSSSSLIRHAKFSPFIRSC